MSSAVGIRRAGEMARVVRKATRFWVVNVTFTLSLGLDTTPPVYYIGPTNMVQPFRERVMVFG